MQNYKNRLRAVLNPNMYHGWGKSKNYFEGWYFKFVDPTERYAFAVIPGISFDKDGKKHAFIQVMDGKKKVASYHNFKADEFIPATDTFRLQLADNQFSEQNLQLNLPELKGELSFQNTTPWPKMLGAPGVMGWYSFVPFMECYHGVVSLFHRLSGSMEINGELVDFTGGIGYVEKDWGQSFPSSWIWMQTNHFTHKTPVSLMVSVARIPWLGTSFVGYLVGFYFEEVLYKFATYTGAKRKTSLEGNKVILSFKDRQYRLELIAHQAEGTDLVSPISGDMAGKVNESMEAEIEVQFYKNNKLIFEDKGRNMGMEIAGAYEELLTDKWMR